MGSLNESERVLNVTLESLFYSQMTHLYSLPETLFRKDPLVRPQAGRHRPDSCGHC
jgi:hypothetical protein